MKPAWGAPRYAGMGFDLAPRTVVWEATRACEAGCRLCASPARLSRDTRELTLGEAREMMDDVRRLGRARLEIAGGEPFRRPDLAKLVEYGVTIGLEVVVVTPATDALTAAGFEQLRSRGLSGLGVVLAGATAVAHERRGGAPGSFSRAMRALVAARSAGIPVEVITPLASDLEFPDLEAMAELLAERGVRRWRPRVPLDAPRATLLESQGVVERILLRLHHAAHRHDLEVAPECAPQFNRIRLQRDALLRRSVPVDGRVPLVRLGARENRGRPVNDGNGLLFIGDRGEICPSGSLRRVAGNVRTHDLVAVYREHALFRALRTPEMLEGKCGYCEFRGPCGGSRARAEALCGNPLGAEPFCPFVPRAYAEAISSGLAEPVADYFANRLPRAAGLPAAHNFITLRELLRTGELAGTDAARA